MKLSDFDYELPPERIAQQPPARRDGARLLVVEPSGRRLHLGIDRLGECLRAGDLLVLNDTRVRPARLFGRKATGGRVELLLVEKKDGSGEVEQWSCLLRASRKPAAGTELALDGGWSARVVRRDGDDWILRFDGCGEEVGRRIERWGRMPLPPYIRREDPDREATADRERYQTVFARRPGAVAAPTAGLHFTPELLAALEAAGVGLAYLTLHVGPGTFQPVREQEVEAHRMHFERFDLPRETVERIALARDGGGRVIAVGTTVVRTLEHCAMPDGRLEAGRGECDLFIRPGHRFRAVDGMLTNFHLPRSTLLMLVCAFAGRERILSAYREAIEKGYRFFSYGDAMLLGVDR